jgi:release factor glutamine methyltransferase
LKSILLDAKKKLKDAGLTSFSLDAELLLCAVLCCDRSRLLLDMLENKKKLTDAEALLYSQNIERRIAGECTAYITGRKEFRYLSFNVNKNVLVPRPETETLVDAALEFIDKLSGSKKLYSGKNICALDICTGSGAIALSLLHERPSLEVYASDICKSALDVAKKNAKDTKLDVKFIHSDLFKNIEQKFNLIITNPPYIPSDKISTLEKEVQNEPHIALDGGKDGLQIIKKIIADAKKYLFSDGALFIEADSNQTLEITELLCKENYIDIDVKKDFAGLERVISAKVGAHLNIEN